MTSIRRAAFVLLLGAATLQAQAHGPSGGGPDDPDASARLLRFDSGLPGLRRLDERPVAWTTLFDSRAGFTRRSDGEARVQGRDDIRPNLAANIASEGR